MSNVNLATPYCDWDVGDYSIEEYEVRFWCTVKEMIATFSINIFVTVMMMLPMCYTGNMNFK